jgi:hypothetical protein
MPFKRVDTVQEQRELDELLKLPEAKKAYDEFSREYEFRQMESEDNYLWRQLRKEQETIRKPNGTL